MGRKENRKNNTTKVSKVVEKQEKLTLDGQHDSNDYEQLTLLIKIVIILIIIIFASYVFLGIFVTKEINFDNLFGNNDNIEQEVVINYSHILAGSIFDQAPTDYYVIAYDFTSEESDLISYKLGQTLLVTPYYYVNNVDLFNAKYVSLESSNKAAQKESDLLINGATLIRVQNGKNILYLEGKDAIVDYLDNLKPVE